MVEMKGQNIQDFYGAWKLVSIETRQEDGKLFRRGQRTGYILYTDNGYVSVAFMKEDRPKFISGDIRGGTTEEKIAAVEGYVSYCGRYEVKEETVVHHIEVSLFPNWIGMKQERTYLFEGDRLTLSTPLMLVGGRQLSTHIIWERASKP
jgi:hypothetical protein